MPITGKEKLDEQRKEQLDTVARISLDIRRAVIASLPTPPEQFLTLNVPGKVLNFKDFTDGWDDEGNAKTVAPPLRVQLNEAILCDDMPTLSGIQLGPTGRSIAQSYGATLSKFCPAGSTTGIPDDATSLTDEEKRYQDAMNWLLYKDPDHPKQSRIDLYKEKQAEYTDAFERKIKAFNDVLERVVADPRYPTLKEQREAYDRWVQVNQKTYNNHIQAAYMDWVTTGKKEEVEYYFAVVDNDSAMSRVEASKKAMRNAIVSDPDGTVEYSKVILTPSNCISPGPNVLSKLMDPGKEYVADEDEKLSREQLLQRYEMFPMYPTSFILAANVVLEITGETSDIQSHFATSTTSAGSYIGYSPFSIGGSYSNTSTSASSTCEATANGCKITIKSPQIIGWVSQIVPALPRAAPARP
ncbi:hypothetical protein BDM02DRAFT_3235284 [Thelephora ganbajun]|uniref:Uncharacterized protein n=1 Tax=Thelephora ganbajun TaxID=370292 RepID=A0ACB6YZG5_THEGA|nr:hypothetical protein BDM02DRAFT_3235284 [Thelephora ganbajun]